MNFKYTFTPYSQNIVLINSASSRLYNKLKVLPLSSLPISDYNKKYLGDYINTLHFTLQRYAYLLSLSVPYDPKRSSIILDYGGGCGILSLLAKEAGYYVIYNDNYDTSVKDARTIAGALNLEADEYLSGEITDIVSQETTVDTLVSYDVIEHIYDIEDFCRLLPYIAENVILASSANMYNPKMNRKIMAHQRKVEYEGQEDSYGHKDRDSLKAFYDIRVDIIEDTFPDVDDYVVHWLASATRGKDKADIIKAVNKYLREGIFPKCITHPTNTVDPNNSNWEEHLMDVDELKKHLQNVNYNVRVLSGYYGSHERNLKSSLYSSFMNLRIPFQGLKVAPYYVLCGDFNTSKQ